MSSSFYDRVLPHDEAAERAVLGSILIDGSAAGEALATLGGIERPFFFEKHGELFTVLTEMVSAGKEMDAIVIKDELLRRGRFESLGGFSFLVGLAQSVPSALRVRHYAAIVRRYAMLRAIIGEAHHMAEAAFDDFADPEALAAESISRLGRAATSDQNAQETAHIADFLAVLDEPAKPRVPSGLALLDDLTGGFPRGAVTIVAAKTSRGKTAFACSCAFNIAEQFELGSLIVSAEMPRREIVMRLACLASGQSYTRWDRQMLTENQNRILRDWAAKLARDKRLAVLDCSKPMIGRIAVEIAKAVEKLGTRIVFVDYLQLCRPNPGEQFDRRDLAVHFVSTELLSIAKRHDIPVVALSQVNEDGELRESRGIEHDANTVIYLEAPDMERELGSREFITERAMQAVVRKNRGGRVGTVNLTMLTGPMRFMSDQVPEAQRVAEAAAEAAAQTRMGW